MRIKVTKYIVTFYTTAEAIAFEKACKEYKQPGRLIPVPRQLCSGCGLAWSASAEEMGVLEQFIVERGLSTEQKGLFEL